MAWYNRWWISPGGEIITVKGESHVDDIIRDPEKFGTTRDHVEEVYRKHGERLGLEGHAREELMKEAMDLGWIRARDNSPGLSLETGNIKKYKNVITDAIISLIEKGLAHKYDPIMAIDWRTGDSIQANNFADLMKSVFASKKKGYTPRLLKIVR